MAQKLIELRNKYAEQQFLWGIAELGGAGNIIQITFIKDKSTTSIKVTTSDRVLKRSVESQTLLAPMMITRVLETEREYKYIAEQIPEMIFAANYKVNVPKLSKMIKNFYASSETELQIKVEQHLEEATGLVKKVSLPA